ncbi:MAG TPA: 1-acyl-sn-glycerol-3-phosphate acyltransferase [Sphingomicrobium sp.]|nr:1-acyl-sn-glycerol-3-phosphate acyltransferase [Sphingomicrobium sp.]
MALFAVLAPVHIVTKTLFRRSRWPRRFLSGAAWIIGARVSIKGRSPNPHTLLVANHTSWLDILVLGGATGCTFVSKDQLGHPLIHWLADQNETVYVKRTHRKGAKDQAVALARSLERKQPVMVFPEGTTGPGIYLLPFRSTLLEAGNFASRDVSIRPVAVDYHDNRASVGWYHEGGKENVLRLLGRSGTLPVTVHLLSPLDRTFDRKQLALEAREAIGKTLGLTSLHQSPIGGRE